MPHESHVEPIKMGNLFDFKWTRRGWMGAGYLVARRLDPDGKNSHLVGRFGQD